MHHTNETRRKHHDAGTRDTANTKTRTAGMKYGGSKHYHYARAAGAVTNGLQCGHQHGVCAQMFCFNIII